MSAWGEAEEALDGALGQLESARPSPDLLQLLRRTGERAAEAGQSALAFDALDAAATMAGELGDDGEGAAIKQALAGLT